MNQWAVMRDGKVMIVASSEAQAREMLDVVKAKSKLHGGWTVAELKEEPEG